MTPGPPPPTVTVRRVRAEEWAELRECRLTALRSDPEAFGSTLDRELAFPEETWRNRTLRGAEAPDTATFVARESGGRAVGLATIVNEGEARAVYGMWVEPAHRRAGVAAELLDRCLAWGPQGLAVRLEVNPELGPAVALYRSRGFQPTGSARPMEGRPGLRVIELRREPPA